MAYEAGRQSRETADRIKAANLPKIHREAGVDLQLTEPWVTAKIKTFKVVQRGGMVALLGPPGTGKTQIAAEMVKCMAIAGKWSLYTQAQLIFMDIRECYRQGSSKTERDIVNKYSSVHLLVIDDIHQRGNTDSENRLLFLILDQRYGAMKPTILTANIDPDAFQASIGSALFDRLREHGGILMCDWESFRGAK